MSCLVPCRADRQRLVFGNSSLQVHTIDWVGGAANPSPQLLGLQSSPPRWTISKLLLPPAEATQCSGREEKHRRAGWMSGEMLQRRAAQLQLGVLHLRLRLHPGPTRATAVSTTATADLNLGTSPDPARCRLLRFVSVVSVPRFPDLSKRAIFSQPSAQSAPDFPPIEGLLWVGMSLSLAMLPFCFLPSAPRLPIHLDRLFGAAFPRWLRHVRPLNLSVPLLGTGMVAFRIPSQCSPDLPTKT